jgi:hypothetical protein
MEIIFHNELDFFPFQFLQRAFTNSSYFLQFPFRRYNFIQVIVLIYFRNSATREVSEIEVGLLELEKHQPIEINIYAGLMRSLYFPFIS